MLTLNPRLAHHDEREAPFIDAMADAPGEGVNLLVFADWLDEHDRPALADAVRICTPRLVRDYHRAAAFLDVALGLNLERVAPVNMPRPDCGRHHSRRQWVGVVRAALKPFAIPHLTVAVAEGWRGGPEVELHVPACDLAIGDGASDGFVVPWGLNSSDVVAAGTLVFAALMPRLFPRENPRTVHHDGDTFATAFWRVVIRPQT